MKMMICFICFLISIKQFGSRTGSWLEFKLVLFIGGTAGLGSVIFGISDYLSINFVVDKNMKFNLLKLVKICPLYQNLVKTIIDR